jgi:hypothetical protein
MRLTYAFAKDYGAIFIFSNSVVAKWFKTELRAMHRIPCIYLQPNPLRAIIPVPDSAFGTFSAEDGSHPKKMYYRRL